MQDINLVLISKLHIARLTASVRRSFNLT